MNPKDFGIKIPLHLNIEDFNNGFRHGMKSNTLTKFKLSYRMGFRAAKLLLKEIRKQQGIINFPTQGKIKLKAIHKDET